MTQEPEAAGLSKLLTEAIVLAVVSGIGYCMAYAYEFAIAEYYGYPEWLIQVDLRSVIVMGASLILACFLLGAPLFFVAMMLPARYGAVIGRRFGLILFLLLFLAVLAWAVYEFSGGKLDTERKWIFRGVLVLAVGVLGHVAVTPLFSRHYNGGIIERWEQASNREDQKMRAAIESGATKLSVFDQIMEKSVVQKRLGLGVLTLLVAVVLTSAIAHTTARNKILYLIPDTEPRRAAVRGYGDYVIVAELGIDGVLRPNFQILSPQDGAATTWRLMRVGPLRVVKPSGRRSS